MITFSDLYGQNNSIRTEIEEAIGDVIQSSQFILGASVEKFERNFASFCKTEYSVGVNSGTSALHLALLALGLKPGDEVITTAHTFVATVAAILYTGATPVLVDIDPDRFTINPDILEKAISNRTKAIIPVHLYGQPADMGSIMEISNIHGIPIIEDAAQAHGAEFKGMRAGAMGLMGCFSFYPGKNLGALGEAGGIVTNDKKIFDRLRSMRDWGQTEKGRHQYPCFNYRMDGIQGAVLDVKLRYLNKWNSQRQRLAEAYDRLLRQSNHLINIELPRRFPDSQHVYHQYVIQVDERDMFRDKLLRLGVQTGVHYPLPIHLQPGFRSLGYKQGDFPNAERVTSRAVSLPIYPELPEKTIEKVADAIEVSINSIST